MLKSLTLTPNEVIVTEDALRKRVLDLKEHIRRLHIMNDEGESHYNLIFSFMTIIERAEKLLARIDKLHAEM